MKHNSWDEVIHREKTDAVKVDMMKEIWGTKDLIPMWVADMDIKTPDFVLNSVSRIIQQEVIGYTVAPPQWYESIVQWQLKRHQWEINKASIFYFPGVVAGLSTAIAAFTQPGDGVMIFKPVYTPFFEVIENQNRKLINVPLIEHENTYVIDFDLMERKLKECKVLILCHPHNPCGRVWSQEELQKIALLCQRNNVLVISDEIHADLSYIPHHSFATVSPEARDNCITFNSPSKAFNMAGFNSAYGIVQNPVLRSKLNKYLLDTKLIHGHAFAYRPVIAAYTKGENWLHELKQYLQENINFTLDFFHNKLPKIKVRKPEATYLLWLDCRELHLNEAELNDFFAKEAGLALNSGQSYGEEGKGFMRMNIACSRVTLTQALQQLEAAYLKKVKD